MPVVQITMLEPPGVNGKPFDWSRATTLIARVVATAFECEPGRVWCTVALVPPGGYAIDGDTPETQPAGSHDPIVRVMAYTGRDDATIARVLGAAADAVCGAFGLEPGTVFVLYEELKPGRVYTGGRVRG